MLNKRRSFCMQWSTSQRAFNSLSTLCEGGLRPSMSRPAIIARSAQIKRAHSYMLALARCRPSRRPRKSHRLPRSTGRNLPDPAGNLKALDAERRAQNHSLPLGWPRLGLSVAFSAPVDEAPAAFPGRPPPLQTASWLAVGSCSELGHCMTSVWRGCLGREAPPASPDNFTGRRCLRLGNGRRC